ncbi:MAG: 5-(carboxyamino)imidazole ribonucleotide synthase [Bacteroidota bacterium]
MNKEFYSGLKLGVLGGGQLGRMLIQAAIDLNVYIKVLDPSAEAPCKAYAHEFVEGSLQDFDTVVAFGQDVDILTIEIEKVNTDALAELQKQGKKVFPDPSIIKLIQSKCDQKQYYVDQGLPTSPFRLVENAAAIKNHLDMLPAVQKLDRDGYDGRGVQVLKTEEDLPKAMDAPGLLEAFVPFEKEIAIIIARNSTGEIKTFPIVEMVFHPVHNLVEYLFSPAELSQAQFEKAEEIAKRLVEGLDFVGLLAIEMFVDKSGDILINEIAPRPHNSGHQSIRGNLTSQYEQHLRAILGLPLGETDILSPSAMVNLLGADGHKGRAIYKGIEDLLRIGGAYPHIYGKAETKPFRKMGHVTIIAEDLERLKEKVKQVKESVEVISE